MTSVPLPELERRFACITLDDSPVIAALISCYFNEPGTYFPIFAFPNIDKSSAKLIDRDEDGHLGQIIGTQSAIFINNAVVRLRPKKVILAGMSSVHKSYFHSRFPKDMLIEIDSEEMVNERLGFLNKQFGGVVPCKRAEVIQGLIVASQTNRELRIDESAVPLAERFLHGAKGLAVLEYNRDSQMVASVNYAVSIGVDIALVAPVDRSQADAVQKLIYEWKEGGSTSAYSDLQQSATDRLKGINFLDYEFCTFFTRGLPYGLILKNIIPITHVQNNIVPDLFIFNNIAHERIPIRFNSAVVFSPEFFDYEETDDVIRILDNHNFVVRSVLGADATVKAFNNYAAHFPYDGIHICSHGGETDGYYVIEKFNDRTGAQHTLEYEEIVGFAPVGKKTVEVTSKAIFRRFDGFPWFSAELEKMPRFIFEDMAKKVFGKEDTGATVRVKANYPIYSSCHIKCSDSLHQGSIEALASHSAPFVFNNTCSSWHEIATSFVAAGARSYIGTLWKIGTKTARNAANTFYEELAANGNILFAFEKMAKGIPAGPFEQVYILWGLHFSTLTHPPQKSDQKVFVALVRSFLRWNKMFLSNPDAEIRRNCIPVLNFISREIMTKFGPDRMKSLPPEVKAKLDIDVKEEPEVDRGVIDL